MPPQLISFFGLLVMMALAWLMSSHKRRVSPRVVIGGLFLQFAFAVLILRTKQGNYLFQQLGAVFTRLLEFVNAGSVFVFGEKYQDYYFAFKVLPTIIFFSSLMSILYYFGVMQWIVKWMARLMQLALGTSGAETLSAAANIFVGQTEAPLVIRPYVETMTRSELMVVMVGGFATIAGGVLAVYVSAGIDAVHLLTASVISAPAALLIAKILQPETEQPKTMGKVQVDAPSEAVNAIHAASIGAADGAKLAINVAAMLIAFLALIAMLNFGIEGAGDWLHGRWVFRRDWVLNTGWWSLPVLLGYAFAPLAWVMGVESGDCVKVGELLGLRMVGNELIAYEQMGEWLKSESGPRLSERSQMIATYALCGFANFGSIGIQIGGIGPLAPSRQGDLARLGLRAMLGGLLACYMTACVAGILVG
jgi:CNT family concentrative nucleoside transporter